MLQMLTKDDLGDTEAGRDRKTNSAQADKTHGFWPNYRFVNEPGSIQWNNFILANNRNSLQMMHSSVRLQDCYYTVIIT